MRSGLTILLIIAILFGAGYWYHTVLAVCDVPLSYRIGAIDPRFKISEEAVRNAVSSAESLWEDGTDRNLFTYDASGEIVITLVYDERQARAEAQEAFEATLDKKENVSDSVKVEYDVLVKKYSTLKATYESQVDVYENELGAYNSEVADWNRKGGAPKDVFERLERTQEELRDEEKRLGALSRELNGLVTKINALSSQGNALVTDYNSLVNEYNEEFGEVNEFTQGEYTKGVITVYEFGNDEELSIVLAHEMGHALGLGHVEGESSIMYHHMGRQVLTSGLTMTDVGTFQAQCGVSESNMVETLTRIKAVLLGMLRSFGA